MSTPLTDRINSLISQANEATRVSDTTLSDAVETLIAGYGQDGGAETVTVTTTATNTSQCMRNIFGSAESGYLYAAVLTGKQKASWVTDQFICAVGAENNGIFQGTTLRFRNSIMAQANIANNYDAKIEIGDVFTILKIPYS